MDLMPAEADVCAGGYGRIDIHERSCLLFWESPLKRVIIINLLCLKTCWATRLSLFRTALLVL
jgi:hypothetical protein